MLDKKSDNESQFLRAPARVLGCLEAGTVTVIVCPGNGHVNGGVPVILPVELIPFDLRMPNSEFDVVLDRKTGFFTEILRTA